MFHLRVREICAYLKLMRVLERSRAPRLVDGAAHTAFALDRDQLHVLKASVFLHLYNLVESTTGACFQSIAERIHRDGHGYRDLSAPWRRAWLRAHGHVDLDARAEGGLSRLAGLVDSAVGGSAVEIRRVRLDSGNLDERAIEKLAERHGITITLTPSLAKRAKVFARGERTPLALIREHRNNLAHGATSFAHCGRDYAVSDLRRWAAFVVRYLARLIASVEAFVQQRQYLDASHRTPTADGW